MTPRRRPENYEIFFLCVLWAIFYFHSRGNTIHYHSVFMKLLFDSLVLLNDFCVKVLKIRAKYQCGKNPLQSNVSLYQTLRQSIFGQASFHSFREIESDFAISIIRQLVELKVRRAFGVLGWYKEDIQSINPLSISLLFDAIEPFEKDIDFSMPFDCLKRIYGWSNIFLHSGIKEYAWKHILVTNYLHEFALGKSKDTNFDHGIVIPNRVLVKVSKAIEEQLPNEAQIIKCQPDAKIVQEAV